MSDKPNPADQHTGPADFAQQAPEQGHGSEIYQLVLHDIITRSEFGARKYGHALRTTADVDYLVNMYQELLDLLIYMRGEIFKRDQQARSSGVQVRFDEPPYVMPQPIHAQPCPGCVGLSGHHTCGDSRG